MGIPNPGAMGSIWDDPASWIGLSAGIVFGLINLLASNRASRKAILLGEKTAGKVMVIGFMLRLILLAVVVLGVPASWMNPDIFVITFLAAFMVGVIMEARNVLMLNSGDRGVGPMSPPRSRNAEIEVEATR